MLEVGEKGEVFRHAARHFPDLVPPGAAGFDDLPLTDRERAAPWYRRPPPGHEPGAGGSPGAGEAAVVSSGTSGPPKHVPWSPREDAWYLAEKQALFAPWLAGCTRGLVTLGAGHNAGSAAELLRRLGLQVCDAGLAPRPTQCEALEAFAPDVLYGSPSILGHLADHLARHGRRPRPVRRVITNGELLLPSVRARFADVFGVGPTDVTDTYGSTEIGTIAFSCGACTAYHLLDGLYPEPAPAGFADTSELTDASGACVLVVSSVKRTSFPVVRFVTYDVVEGLRRGRCGGEPRFTFDRVVGRCDDVLTYGELFSPYPLADLVARRLPSARWIAFNAANDLSLVIEGTEPDGFLGELRGLYPLHARLHELGLIDPPVVRFVADFDAFAARAGLPSSRRGKETRRVVRRAFDPAWLPEVRR